MKKIILFFSLVLFFLPNNNWACSCIQPSSFCESITDNNGDIQPNVILRGEVIRSSPQGKEVAVKQVLYGELDQKEVLIRHGFCTIFYSDLEDGNEYLIALRIRDNYVSLIDCAISFLKIENDIVKGKVAPGIRSIKVKNLSRLASCGAAFDFNEVKNNIVLYPNPTAGKVRIKNTHLEKSFVQLELFVYDQLGRVVASFSNQEGILPEEFWTIDMQYLPSGVYIFKVIGNNQENAFRIIKYES